MNQGHVQSGEIINLETLKADMEVDTSYAIVKTPDMEVIRMALPEGKEVNEHHLDGEVSIQCLKGNIVFMIDGQAQNLTEDDWLYLKKKEPFSYRVEKETILLVTILFASNSTAI